MMTRADRRIFNEFVTRVKERFPDARIWIYGSLARGDAPWDSDFDLFIVLEKVDRELDRWIRETAWKIGFENDCVLTTIVLDREQFEKGPMSKSSLVENILYEGITA